MNVTGNAKIYLKKFKQKDGSERISFSVGIASKKKGSDEFARVYLNASLSENLRKRITDRTPAKFKVFIKDAFLYANEYNGKTEARIHIQDWEEPHEDSKTTESDPLPY